MGRDGQDRDEDYQFNLESQQPPGLSRRHGFLQFIRTAKAYIRHWMPSGVEGLPDDFERFMHDQDRFADPQLQRRLLNDYAHLKDRLGGPLMNSKVSYDFFPSQEHVSQCPGGSQLFYPTSTISDCFSNLQSLLQTPSVDNFQPCTIASDNPHLNHIFSSVKNISATLSGRQHQMISSPKYAVILLIAHFWDLSPSIVRLMLRPDINDKPKWQLKFPSKKPSVSPVDFFDQSETNLILKWQVDVPKYVSDLDFYVWQHYQKAPLSQYALVVQSSSADTQAQSSLVATQAQRVLIVFRSVSQSTRFKEAQLDASISKAHQLLPINELLYSIFTLYKIIIEDTGVFMEGVSDQIEYLRYEGRSSPSSSKIQYLLHLEDFRRESTQGMGHILNSLHSLELSINAFHRLNPEWEDRDIFLARLDESIVDIEYLGEQLEFEGRRTDKVRKSILEQLGLQQIRRSTILGFLAIVYVPLAFTLSFFGMNINDPDFKKCSRQCHQNDKTTL